MIWVQNVHSTTLSEIIRHNHRGVSDFFQDISPTQNFEIRPKRRVEIPTYSTLLIQSLIINSGKNINLLKPEILASNADIKKSNPYLTLNPVRSLDLY